MDGGTHFITLNSDGTSHAEPLTNARDGKRSRRDLVRRLREESEEVRRYLKYLRTKPTKEEMEKAAEEFNRWFLNIVRDAVRKAKIMPKKGKVPEKAPAEAQNRTSCGCETCAPRTEPEPLDREENLRLARELDELAAMLERAGDLDTARTIRERALICHDLEEVEARNEARRAATMTEVRVGRKIRPIIGAPWEDSVLND